MKRSTDCADLSRHSEAMADYTDLTDGLAILVESYHHFNLRNLCNPRIKPICNPRNGLLALVLLATSVSADPAQAPSKTSPASSPSLYTVINHIGEADQQVTLREDKLLAHRRMIDPFGIAIRGKFKGLPPVEQHPAGTNLPVQAVKAVTNELTLEKAIQQLPVGAVNITDREALIGVQSIREGDLLVLQLSGHQFVVWVESIDRRGVQFCDIDLQHHALKPVRFGPTQLPQTSATGRSDVRDFLKEDGN